MRWPHLVSIAVVALTVVGFLGPGFGAVSLAPAPHAVAGSPSAAVHALPAPAVSIQTRALESLQHGDGPARGALTGCQFVGSSSFECARPGGSSSTLRAALPSPAETTATHAASGGPLSAHASITLPPFDFYNTTYFTTYLGGPTTFYGSVAYDPELSALVLWEGCSDFGGCPTGETWLYNFGYWENVTGLSPTSPTPRYGTSMDYDPLLGGVVLFGGVGLNGTALNETWLFNGVWENMTNLLGPSAPNDIFGAMAWDPAMQGMLLSDGCLNPACSSRWSGTWLLNSTGWSVLGPGPGGYTGFYGASSMAYDATDGYMLYFGGYNGTQETNYTFTFSAGTWTNITGNDAGCFFVCFTPPGRYFDQMTYDGQLGMIYLTSGFNYSSFTVYNDSWVFLGGYWYPAFLVSGTFAPADYLPGFLGTMPVNSTDIAPVRLGGECVGADCSGSSWVFEAPPVIANLSYAPHVVDDNAVIVANVTGVAGYGSGPKISLGVDWGDAWVTFGTGAEPNVSVNWTAAASYVYGWDVPPGNYSAFGYAYDFFGVSGPSVDFNVSVVANLTLGVTATPNETEVGGSVALAATSTNGLAPYNFSWEYGDGSTGFGASVTHAYVTAGTFQVNVTASDAGAGTNTTSTSVEVFPALGATWTSAYPAVDAGVGDTFTGSPSGGSGTYSTFNWTFGDGSHATTESATHTFATAGTYHVSLEVTDSLGYTAYHNVSVVVNAALSLAPTASPTPTTTGTNVTFSAGTSGGTSPYTYAWKFGDGSSSTLSSPGHAFATAGTYTVQLWVNDSGGGSAHSTVSVVVNASSTSGSSSSSGFPTWVIIVIVIVVVAVIAAALLMMRRGKTPPAATPPPAGATGPTSTPPPSGGGPPPGAMG